jgi:uncharacterized NAD(P)/FAD-binding protein YdhS
LQTRIISNLTDSINILNKNVKIKDLFSKESDYNTYKNWLKKFANDKTIDDFREDFT